MCRTVTPGGADAVRAATWSAQCPTTITTRRTPTAWSASSIQARIGRPPTGRSAFCVWSVRGARRRATPAARMTAVTPVSGMSRFALERPWCPQYFAPVRSLLYTLGGSVRAGSCPAVEDARSRRGRVRPNEQDVIPAVQDGAVGRSRRGIAGRSVPARRLRGGPWALRRGRDAADLGVDRRAAGSARSAGAADDVLRAEPAASRRARAPTNRKLLPLP